MDEEEILERLKEDIIGFKTDDIRSAVRLALESGVPPRTIILKGMAPGMDVVGRKYADYEYFLPELVMAGETMNEGVSELKPYLGSEKESQGTVVIGTVAGDIHDVGKNIVSNILTGAGFTVIDVGTDVGEETFLESIREYNADVLGMSALLSSSLHEMKKVIVRLRKEGLRTKVIVGGAPLSRKISEEMGADAYGEDAFAAIKILREWMGEKNDEEMESEQLACIKSEEEGKEALVRTLYGDDRIAARNAGIALGKAKATSLLLEAFRKKSGEFSAIALGRTGDRRCSSILIDALKSDDEGVRAGAAEGLGYMKGKKAVAHLIEALEDESSEVRCRAIFSLGMLGDARAIGHLTGMLKDENRKVRWRAAWTLGDFGEAGYRNAFGALIMALKDEDWNVRRMIVLTLRHDDPEVLSCVIEALHDENKFVRKYAAFVLGRSSRREAIPHLKKLLADKSRQVRSMAGWALHQIES